MSPFSTYDDEINSPVGNNIQPSSLDKSSPELSVGREIIVSMNPSVVL